MHGMEQPSSIDVPGFDGNNPRYRCPHGQGKGRNEGTNRCHMEDPTMPRLNPNHHGLCFVPSIPPIFRSFHGMVASIPNHPFFHPSIHSMSMHPPCLVLGPVLVGYPFAHEGVPRVGPTCFLFLHPPRPFLPLPWVACLCPSGWNAPSLHLQGNLRRNIQGPFVERICCFPARLTGNFGGLGLV